MNRPFAILLLLTSMLVGSNLYGQSVNATVSRHVQSVERRLMITSRVITKKSSIYSARTTKASKKWLATSTLLDRLSLIEVSRFAPRLFN